MAALETDVFNGIRCSLKPRRAVEELTQKIKEADKYLDLPVMDHLIMTGEDNYYFLDDEDCYMSLF